MPADHQVVVGLSSRVLASLEHLARSLTGTHGYPAGMTAADVLAELAQRVDDGVRRPGSWERPWLRSAFPLDALEASEQPEPDAPWRSLVPENQP
jgi:hypothetical protein